MPVSQGDPLHLFGKRVGHTGYFLLEHLGGVGRANVYYRGWSPRTNRKVVVKLERMNLREQPEVWIEFNFHCLFGAGERSRHLRLNKALAYGQIDRTRWCALVLPVLGPTLAQQHAAQPSQQFAINTTVSIARQLLTIYQEIHRQGFVYRDTHPENFCFGLQSDPDTREELYVCDLGSCALHDKDDVLGREQQAEAFAGHVLYTSINNHNERRWSPRDDIESLGYLFVHLARGTLPWEDVQDDDDHRNSFRKVGEMKRTMAPALLCFELPDMFKQMIEMARAMKFEDAVDFLRIWNMFEQHRAMRTAHARENEVSD